MFEGRRQCFFRPYPARSSAFDSHLCHFIEVHKVKLLEIHNVWHKVLMEKILEVGDQRSIAKIFFVTADAIQLGGTLQEFKNLWKFKYAPQVTLA